MQNPEKAKKRSGVVCSRAEGPSAGQPQQTSEREAHLSRMKALLRLQETHRAQPAHTAEAASAVSPEPPRWRPREHTGQMRLLRLG